VDAKVRDNLKDLPGEKGIIIFRDFISATFYPIRFFTLLKAQKIGKIYYFEYELEGIVDYDSDETWRRKQIAKINEDFPQYHSTTFKNNIGSKDMSPLVLLSNFSFDVKNDHYCSSDKVEMEHEQWGNIATIIKNMSFFDGVEFIRILDVIPMSNDASAANFKDNSLYLREGCDYKLRILQLVPMGGKQKTEPRDITITSDGRYISVVRGKERAVGKYDVLTFVFRTNARSGGYNSFIDIEHTPISEGRQYIEPKLYIPVVIEKSIDMAVMKVCLGLIFGALYVLLNVYPQSNWFLLKDLVVIAAAISIHELLYEIRGFFKRN